MTYDRFKHHRRSVRLPEYDYAQPGAYFVTMVTHGRECLFGEVVNAVVRLNEYGEIVEDCWRDVAAHFPTARPDTFIVMPNHFHGIIVIMDDRRGMACHAPTAPESKRRFAQPIACSLAAIVGSFKSAVTKRINVLRGTPGWSVWQRNYHDEIVRDDDELRAKREYIVYNAARWDVDRENPMNIR